VKAWLKSLIRPDALLYRRALAQPGPRLLHIGCGDHPLPGWVNTDHRPGPWTLPHLDATRRFPFPDATWDRAYSEHMIEHVPQPQGLAMLRECHRVLKPGGRIRIVTPDLAFLVALQRPRLSPLQRRYLAWSARAYPGCLQPSGAFALNNYVRAWGHQFIYDRATLSAALAEAGFRGVRSQPLGRSRDPLFRGLENQGRMPAGFLQLESLALEAER
jgi:predicted SAM-dependent methyltransferase